MREEKKFFCKLASILNNFQFCVPLKKIKKIQQNINLWDFCEWEKLFSLK